MGITELYKRLFHKKQTSDAGPMPGWETVVEMMYDKYLDTFSSEVVDVLYSIDRSMRYVILKNERGLLTYQLEALYQYDDEEWSYIRSDDHALPAIWEPYKGIVWKPFFENAEELLNELKQEPEYKQYFI